MSGFHEHKDNAHGVKEKKKGGVGKEKKGQNEGMGLKVGQRKKGTRRENVQQVRRYYKEGEGGRGRAGQGKIQRTMQGKRERNREGETEVTRSKLMHGQLSESRRQRKTEFVYEHE